MTRSRLPGMVPWGLLFRFPRDARFMTFLNPLLLMALAAAAIPLIIHLFNFRKPKRIDFSSLAFLQDLQKSTMQRVRIKQWLLLLLRTVAIAALVLSFARPTMNSALPGFVGKGRSSTAIVFDNSNSMALRDGDGAYLEQARNIAVGLIDEMEAGDEMFILPTISAAGNSPPFQNQSSARQAVMDISNIGGNMILSQSIRNAAERLGTSANPNREIYVLSDLQESTFVDSLDADLPEDVRVFLLPIGNQVHDNVAVSDVRILSRIVSSGQVVRAEVSIENYGERALSNLVVSLFLEDTRVGQATVDVGSGEIATTPVAFTPRSYGWLRGRVEIQDAEYEIDDRRDFTLYIPEERNVLLVAGSSADSRFLDLALSSEMRSQRMELAVEQIDETVLSGVSLGQYDAVILNGVSDLSSGERALISRYIKDGGGLLLFPGDEMESSDYNALLAELAAGQFEQVIGDTENGASVAVFDQIDHEHALFEGMFEDSPDGGPPRLEQPDIYRMIPYRPGTGDEQTLIRMTGDQVFLQEIQAEKGSLLLFTVAPTLSWTDFPARGLFVPLLYRSIYYLSAAGSIAGEEFSVGSAAQLRLSGLENSSEVTIEDADGAVYRPEIRRVPGGVVVSIEAGLLRPGIYDVIIAGNVIRSFAVHPRKLESDLRTLGHDAASTLLSGQLKTEVAVVDLSSAADSPIGERLQTARTGVELWNVFLLLALSCLIAEMIVEKKWRPESV